MTPGTLTRKIVSPDQLNRCGPRSSRGGFEVLALIPTPCKGCPTPCLRPMRVCYPVIQIIKTVERRNRLFILFLWFLNTGLIYFTPINKRLIDTLIFPSLKVPWNFASIYSGNFIMVGSIKIGEHFIWHSMYVIFIKILNPK